jgi:5,10-methylenetetrahydrofolate reductase
MKLRTKIVSNPPWQAPLSLHENGDEPRFATVQPVVMYEIIPPAKRSLDAFKEKARRLSSLLSRTHVDAINIPEIRDESGQGIRPIRFSAKTEPRVFAAIIQHTLGIDTIVNRVSVHNPSVAQYEWLKSTYHDYGVENLILVGGESPDVVYPGPGVTKMGDMVTKFLNQGWQESDSGNHQPVRRRTDFFCGGVTIHTRREEDPALDEPARLITKAKHGLQFFTSQANYEARSCQALLTDYDVACTEQRVDPKRIILSFAPISSPHDLQFLKWLGVYIPPEVEKYLLHGGKRSQMSERSLEISRDVLGSVLNHVIKNKLTVPLGINVEHIMNHNFSVSIEMIQELSALYRTIWVDQLFPVKGLQKTAHRRAA